MVEDCDGDGKGEVEKKKPKEITAEEAQHRSLKAMSAKMSKVSMDLLQAIKKYQGNDLMGASVTKAQNIRNKLMSFSMDHKREIEADPKKGSKSLQSLEEKGNNRLLDAAQLIKVAKKL